MYVWIILYNTKFEFRFNMKENCIVLMQKYLTYREQEGYLREKLEIEKEGRKDLVLVFHFFQNFYMKRLFWGQSFVVDVISTRW